VAQASDRTRVRRPAPRGRPGPGAERGPVRRPGGVLPGRGGRVRPGGGPMAGRPHHGTAPRPPGTGATAPGAGPRRRTGGPDDGAELPRHRVTAGQGQTVRARRLGRDPRGGRGRVDVRTQVPSYGSRPVHGGDLGGGDPRGGGRGRARRSLRPAGRPASGEQVRVLGSPCRPGRPVPRQPCDSDASPPGIPLSGPARRLPVTPGRFAIRAGAATEDLRAAGHGGPADIDRFPFTGGNSGAGTSTGAGTATGFGTGADS